MSTEADLRSQIERRLQEYYTIMADHPVDERDMDPAIVEKHVGMLKVLETLEANNYQLFDLHQQRHVYVSSRLDLYLGLGEGESVDSRTLPEDMLALADLGTKHLRFAYSVPVHKRFDYKLTMEFRVIGRDGGIVRLVKNYIPLELDRHGNYWLVLCTLNISPDFSHNMPLRSRLVDVRTGETLRIPDDSTDERDQLPFSAREIEVLELLAQGLSSKQIAPLLTLSVHTVNTHRQNLMRKTGLKNTAEVIRFAMDRGVLL
jgi:DNA-binding CsgD family transcriptional regulator